MTLDEATKLLAEGPLPCTCQSALSPHLRLDLPSHEHGEGCPASFSHVVARLLVEQVDKACDREHELSINHTIDAILSHVETFRVKP